jgi:LAGLIDADG endonuclease
MFNHSLTDFLNVYNIKDKKSINNRNKLEDNDFIQWLIGFTDAEGSFKFNIKNNKEVHFIYQITLHIDDISVLYFIREKLGIGIVSINGTNCSFRVHSFQSIVDILLPIFDKYSLLSHKQLNYKD